MRDFASLAYLSRAHIQRRLGNSNTTYEVMKKLFYSLRSVCCNIYGLDSVMCPRGLVLVLEAPRGQRAVALGPKSLALVLALR